MPCRKKCCGHHATPRVPSEHTGRTCVHSQSIPRAVIVSSSRSCLPNAPGPCDHRHASCNGSHSPRTQPGTPSSNRSKTSCVQEYCTSETCRNSGNCCDNPPQYCPYGKREENEEAGACGVCKAQGRTASTRLPSSDSAPRSSNPHGACPTVSANTSAMNLPPAPRTQRHQMSSCCGADKEQQATPSVCCKPIIRQQSNATDQSPHRVSRCPSSCNAAVEPPNLSANTGCGRNNKPFEGLQADPYPQKPNKEQQSETQCPVSCDAAEELPERDTECGQPECTSSPTPKQQPKPDVQSPYRASQCPISCNTSHERSSTGYNPQCGQPESTSKVIQAQSEPQCPTTCKTTRKSTLSADTLGCGQPGCTKRTCGTEAEEEKSQLSLGGMLASQTGAARGSSEASLQNGVCNACPGSKGGKSLPCEVSPGNKDEAGSRQSKGAVVPSVTCTSPSCPGSKSAKCLCRYPPSFSQYTCTGNITGDCDCARDN